MAVGDLIVQDYQYEYNGLLMGKGTPYIMSKITGLLGAPPVRDEDKDRDDAWGDFPGMDLYSPRYISYDVWFDESIHAGLEAEQALDLLMEAHQIDRNQMPHEWVMQRPDWRGKRYCWAKPRTTDFDAGYNFSRGLCLGSIQVKAHDPRYYSLAETAVAIVIANATTSKEQDINYGGKVDGAPVLEINGPCTDPWIQNQDDNSRAIRLDGTIPAGQTVIVDVKRRTVTQGGLDVYRTLVRPDNQWWHLVPGLNRVTYSRTDAGAASTLNVKYRKAWVS